jgi:probable F420-dependent oxidoreductase
VKPHNERRFSAPWSPPVPRLREYVNALRAIWNSWEKGDRLKFEGKHYTFTLMTPAFVPESKGLPMVPIRLAAVGEHSLRLAGEVADGVLLHPFCTRLYLEKQVLPRVAEGLAKSGRARENFEINGGGFVVSGRTPEEIARNFEWVRERIAFYGSTPAYWPVFELHGLADLGQKLNALSKEGKWKEMTATISDDMVHMFAAVGSHQEIAGAIERHFGGLSDCVSASPNSSIPSTLTPDVVQDIQRIPMGFRGFKTAW